MDRMSFLDQIGSYIEITIEAQGYSRKEFIDFLKYKKQNGDDLKQWSMDELIIVGDKFIAIKQQAKEDNQLISNNVEQKNQTQNIYPVFNEQNDKFQSISNQQTLKPEYQYPQYEMTEKKQNENLYGKPNDDIQQQSQVIQQQQQIQPQIIQQQSQIQEINTENQRYKVYPGQQIQINQNSYLYKHPNIDIVIHSYSEQNGGLFSKSFILYNISIQPYGHFIERRYSDFDKLREYLCKNYPDYYIPPIPKKVSSSTKPITADYRQIALEKFMNMIIKSFWFDPVVDGFFGAQNENDFNKVFKQAKNRAYDITSIKTLTGQVECQISSQIDSYFSYQQQKLDKQAEIFNQIRQLSKKLIATQKQLGQDYKALSEQFLALQCLNRAQNDLMPEKIDELCYKNLQQVFYICSKKQEDIGNIIQKNVTYFYKFQNQFIDSLKEKFKIRETYRDECVKQLQKIDAKIDKQYKEMSDAQIQKSQAQFQTPLSEKQIKQNLFPLEVKSYESLQDNFGYINNNLYQQIQLTINMNQFQTMQSIQLMFQKIQQQYIEILKEIG